MTAAEIRTRDTGKPSGARVPRIHEKERFEILEVARPLKTRIRVEMSRRWWRLRRANPAASREVMTTPQAKRPVALTRRRLYQVIPLLALRPAVIVGDRDSAPSPGQDGPLSSSACRTCWASGPLVGARAAGAWIGYVAITDEDIWCVRPSRASACNSPWWRWPWTRPGCRSRGARNWWSNGVAGVA